MLIGQSVLILGAGISGLATGIALAGRGASVRIVEQAPEITEVGAGIQISPNGLVVLDALGLGPDIRQIGIKAACIQLRDFRHGGLVLRLDLARFNPDQTYLFCHRADLIEILASKARSLGVDIQLGRQVDKTTLGAGGVDISYGDGTREYAALVIGADGLHSRLRPALNGPHQPDFSGFVAWRATVPSIGKPGPDVSVHMGPGRHVVCYPLRGGTLTNIVAVQERDTWASDSWNQQGDPDEMRRAFAQFSPEIRALLDRVDTVNLWGLFQNPVAKTFTGAECALVGDAAHPTLPFLAQGANLALEDAWVLADCLASLPAKQAFQSYQRSRHARVTKVIAAANANARNYHLKNPIARLAAHSLLRAAGFLAPAKVVGQFDWIYGFDVTKT